MTKRQYKKTKGSQTPGKTKCETCQATGLDKAMAKYPRSCKTNSDEYVAFNLKKDKFARRDHTYFTQNFK